MNPPSMSLACSTEFPEKYGNGSLVHRSPHAVQRLQGISATSLPRRTVGIHRGLLSRASARLRSLTRAPPPLDRLPLLCPPPHGPTIRSPPKTGDLRWFPVDEPCGHVAADIDSGARRRPSCDTMAARHPPHTPKGRRRAVTWSFSPQPPRGAAASSQTSTLMAVHDPPVLPLAARRRTPELPRGGWCGVRVPVRKRNRTWAPGRNDLSNQLRFSARRRSAGCAVVERRAGTAASTDQRPVSVAAAPPIRMPCASVPRNRCDTPTPSPKGEHGDGFRCPHTPSESRPPSPRLRRTENHCGRAPSVLPRNPGSSWSVAPRSLRPERPERGAWRHD
jgi:hypothetical protein